LIASKSVEHTGLQ